MKNVIAVAALAAGLALGSASASFAGNVDGGAHPRSGVPNVAEQGASTARGVSRSETPHSSNTDNYYMKQKYTSKHKKKKNKK
jgi:hypothetical protein